MSDNTFVGVLAVDFHFSLMSQVRRVFVIYPPVILMTAVCLCSRHVESGGFEFEQ